MENFYNRWLKFWDEAEAARAKARKVIHEEELEWIQTRQDKRIALLASPDNGFVTQGGQTMLVEIPEGWKTGKHSHGEEVMFIIEGEGSTVIDGERFDWEKGSTLFMPSGAVHQHFNTGSSESQMLRIEFGMRSKFFEDIAKRTFPTIGSTYAHIVGR